MEYKILIADDEAEIRSLLRLYLENEHYQVIEAEDGVQALELLKKEQPALCVLDIMMPKLDGYRVLQKLREESNIPVIILSAKDADSEKILGLSRGRRLSCQAVQSARSGRTREIQLKTVLFARIRQ